MATGPDGMLFASNRRLDGFFAEHHLVTISMSGVVADVAPTVDDLDGLAFRPSMGGDGDIEFDVFDVRRLTLRKRRGVFDLRAGFRLGGDSDGVDIVGESFTLKIGDQPDDYKLTLEPGSFKGREWGNGRGFFVHRSWNRSTREFVLITIVAYGGDRYKIHGLGWRADLGDPVNPVFVKVAIGDDFGEDDNITARIRR